MNKRNTRAVFDFKQMLVDLLFVCVAYLFTYFVYDLAMDKTHAIDEWLWILVVYGTIFILAMHFGSMYDMTLFKYFDRILKRTACAGAFACMVVASIVFLLQRHDTSRLFFVLFAAFSTVAVVLCRILPKVFEKKELNIKGNTSFTNQILFVNVVNENRNTKAAFNEYKRFTKLSGVKTIFVDTKDSSESIISDIGKFENYLASHEIDEVVFVYGANSQFPYDSYMKVCDEMGVSVQLLLDLPQLQISKSYIKSVGTFPVVVYHSVPVDQFQLFLKGALDIILSLIALVITSPILLVTAIAIKLESPGPIFFRQKRVGINGRVFEILKFRSMYIDAEARKKDLMAQNEMKDGMMFKMHNDPRITKVGRVIRKYSIDELPQLINVLKREMSLVGTRPPTFDEVKLYKRHYHRRISIMPGITGMWQVNGRSEILDFNKVIELDTKYIDNWTLGLDLKLIWQTFGVIARHKGAC